MKWDELVAGAKSTGWVTYLGTADASGSRMSPRWPRPRSATRRKTDSESGIRGPSSSTEFVFVECRVLAARLIDPDFTVDRYPE